MGLVHSEPWLFGHGAGHGSDALLESKDGDVR